MIVPRVRQTNDGDIPIILTCPASATKRSTPSDVHMKGSEHIRDHRGDRREQAQKENFKLSFPTEETSEKPRKLPRRRRRPLPLPMGKTQEPLRAEGNPKQPERQPRRPRVRREPLNKGRGSPGRRGRQQMPGQARPHPTIGRASTSVERSGC